MNDPVKLLIIDDEEGIVRNLAAYFEDEGFTVFTADSGEEALEIMAENRIDAAIVDMRLPGINGNDVIEKAFAQGSRTKFIIHTGSNDYKLPKNLIEQGFSEENIFLKPVTDIGHLKTAILKLVAE